MPERKQRQGRVVDAQGRPVPKAIVVVVSGSAPTPEIGIVAGADGRFRVALPEGRFRLAARTEGGGSGACDVDVDGGDAEIVIRIPSGP